MKNFGQLWALVLATEGTESEANSLLGYVLNRAARTAHRERVWAVVTQQHRRRRLLWNTGILAGSAWALLRLIERRVPDIIAQVQAVVRGTNPEAAAELNARLLGLDFHRHVLPGNERYLSVLPVPRCGWTDVSASERSNAQVHRASDEQGDVPTRGASARPPPLFSWSAFDQELP